MATTSEQVIETRRSDPSSVRAYSLTVFGLFAALVLAGVVRQEAALHASVSTLAVWALVAAVADTLRVRLWDDFSFAMSLPVTLAAGMVLDPVDAAVVAFVGAFDLKDFSGEIPIERALCNRATAGISIYVGSAAFHALGFELTDWPGVLLASVIAYALDFLVNVALVIFPVARLQRVSLRQVLGRVLEPTPSQTVLIYVCVGLLSPVIALVSVSVGVLGVAVLLLPLGLARSAYIQALRLHEAAQRVHEKNKALRVMAEQAAEGRRSERLVLAGELKQSVLPSLGRVHLMGQVLRQDLMHGRLLELDDDLPALLAATDAAHSAMAGVMQGLEESAVGMGGLADAIRVLADQHESASPGVRITLDLDDVKGSETAELSVFDLAREVLSNAVVHAHATQISIRLLQADGRIRLVIADNGIGFTAQAAYARRGSGLWRMRELIESVGGDVALVTHPGEGSIVAAAVPTEA